jgi:Fe(3+) dicitrate transport protein
MTCNKYLLFLSVLATFQSIAGAQSLAGSVKDPHGAPVPAIEVRLKHSLTQHEQVTATDIAGQFEFRAAGRGESLILISLPGFQEVRQAVAAGGGGKPVDIVLQPATLAQEVTVSASRIVGTPEQLERLPGSYDFLNAATLVESRVLTTEEALRKVSGIHARSEEGLGLRPNIGIRGLNPTRSTRVLLLEDGLPLSYAPYGDNASYYHPPVDRFDSVEIVKGAGQILFGPMTVGGVVNYLTPPPPSQREGALTLTGGNRDYLNAHLRYGGTLGKTGLLFDVMRKQGEGARENVRHGLSDGNAKMLTSLGTQQTLGLRVNYYTEDSNLTYSGLRESEWLVNPRGNPFRNDFFNISRFGASGNHVWAPSSNFSVNTTAYGSTFFRDWWRQSSNSNQRPNDAADPGCGGMANLFTTCGNEGRLRKYFTWGVEPKARARHRLLGAQNDLDFGFRFHDELQERLQKNGDFPAARDGLVVENNQRKARAYSTFVQNRFVWGKFTVTPGIRFESIRYARLNRLGASGAGVSGTNRVNQWVPGAGASFSPSSRFTVFAGVHRGFAPPRVEDVINNNTGASIELEPERSWIYEAGFRARPGRGSQLEATWFRMDFSNQIIPASVAGGVGATLVNGGETLHQGMELSGRHEFRNLFRSRHSFFLRAAFTHLGDASFSEPLRFSTVSGFANVIVTGNRLPYAPANLLTASAGYRHATGFHLQLESVYTGRQFADDLNTAAGTSDGQRGLVPGNAMWNASVNYPVEPLRTTIFVTAKNLTDRLTIADRTRGLLPGIPRLVQFGFSWKF